MGAGEKLFRALINPRANQSDLLRRERLGRSGAARTLALGAAGWRVGSVRTAGAARSLSAGTARTAAPAATFRRHGRFGVELRDGFDDKTFRAVAFDHDRAFLAALQNAFERIEAQAGLRALRAVATDAR